MSNFSASRLDRFVAPIAILAWISCAQLAISQSTQWKAATNGMMPMLGANSFATSAEAQGMNQAPTPPRRPPLAYLIENPDQSDGASPYALTDQNGTIQRYVEPVPGIDLQPYLGQVVVVRHDSGPTLLASQLELPNQPLYPMVGERGAGQYAGGPAFMPPRRGAMHRGVEQANFVDNDDSSVQLLPEELPDPNSGGNAAPLPMIGGPGCSGQMMPPGMCGPGCECQFGDPMQCGPGCMQQYPGPMMSPYPTPYGGYPCNCDAGQPVNCNQNCNSGSDGRAHFSADVELLFLRPRITEGPVGNLSQTYELSPRFILEARNGGGLDVRARYWHYGRSTDALSDGDGQVRLEFDVLDLEAVHRIEGRRSELSLAAGLRLANLQLTDTIDERCGSHQIGLTMAADGLVQLCCLQNGYCGWVYGGRFSILGGDWDGDDNSVFINREVADDNLLVSELYVGAECARKCGNCNVGGRVVFELQDWNSDALASFAGIQSIGFLGPALQVGVEF
jgi:hypothetical protein